MGSPLGQPLPGSRHYALRLLQLMTDILLLFVPVPRLLLTGRLLGIY